MLSRHQRGWRAAGRWVWGHPVIDRSWHYTGSPCDAHGLQARMCPELGEDPTRVRSHRVDGQDELASDGGTIQAGRYAVEYIALTRCKGAAMIIPRWS